MTTATRLRGEYGRMAEWTSNTQLMRKAATVRNTQVTSSGQTPMELAMGRDQEISWTRLQ